jgi:methylenetetrahydrofolate dehydrogenase (NADP+)/methenyltetrahydrofolate cyclohydrolase
MKAIIYDGKALTARLSLRIKRDTERLRRQRHIEVGLGILLVTGDQVSMADATKVASTAEEVGIKVQIERVAQRNIARKFYPTLEEYAASPFIQGIYVQLPLPTEIIPLEEVMRRLPPQKDVGGIHFTNRGMATFPPHEVDKTVNAPEILAVAATLRECKIELKGGKVALVGSDSTAGMVKLLAGYLYDKGCDVRALRYENMHPVVGPADTPRRLRSIEQAASQERGESINPNGEAIVTWTNQPGWLHSARVKPGSVIIDMGYKFARGLVSGDCDFDSLAQMPCIITPVPGGVRNIVRVMILQNLIQLIKMQIGAKEEQAAGALRRRFGVTSGEGSSPLRRGKPGQGQGAGQG